MIHLLIEMNYIRDRVTVNVHGFALSWPKNDVPSKINLDLIHIQEKSESYNKIETNFWKHKIGVYSDHVSAQHYQTFLPSVKRKLL